MKERPMLPEIKNEFSWSKTQMKSFGPIPHAGLYYGYWKGWLEDAPVGREISS
jgi:hypothetical protein